MINKYKSAAYYFKPQSGFNDETISSLDEWLNIWLKNGYIVDSMSPINKDGTTVGYLYIFKVEY